MCTIGVLFRTHPDSPLVVAQNRDEMRDRPSDPVHTWTPEGATSAVVAGRDQRSGGTWFAVGRRIVSAVTNQRTVDRSPPGARSRGELVTATATADSLAAAEAWVVSLDGRAFGAFHLLVSDGARLLWATNAQGPMTVREVPPGIHVLRNTALDDDEDPVDAVVRRGLQAAKHLPLEACLASLEELLSLPFPEGPNIDLGFYGTRSAGVLAWGGADVRLLTCPTSPAPGRFVDQSALLRALAAAGPSST